MDVATVLSLIPYGNNSNFKKKEKERKKKEEACFRFFATVLFYVQVRGFSPLLWGL